MYDNQDMNFRSYKGYHIVRIDPFGFWVIKDSTGKKMTNESYTMISFARNAIDCLPPRPAEKKKD